MALEAAVHLKTKQPQKQSVCAIAVLQNGLSKSEKAKHTVRM
jgi:hypothetical protein